MIVINPEGLAVSEWCDYTADNLSAFVPVMKVGGDEEWREWGVHSLKTLRSRGVTTPDPYKFDDFNDWARRFNQAIAML